SEGVKIRVPPSFVINSVFFYLLFGPFLIDLPSVISSGTFLAQKQYTKSNIAIAVHFFTLGFVLLIATVIYYFTLNQLTNAIRQYTVPAELTLVNIGISPTMDFQSGQTYTLGPPTQSEKENDELWDTGLSKARYRLISIRNAGTLMLCFYVLMYLTYGIARPLIHKNIISNVIFCLVFNLDPGTPTIYAYFIFSILYRINTHPSNLHQPANISRPPTVHIPASRPARPLSDSYLFDLRRSSSAGISSNIPYRSPSKNSATRSMDLSSLRRYDVTTSAPSEHTIMNMESISP
ncbi:hypothetical protein BGZ46_004596, partial [Entomortierella lignicola]